MRTIIMIKSKQTRLSCFLRYFTLLSFASSVEIEQMLRLFEKEPEQELFVDSYNFFSGRRENVFECKEKKAIETPGK